jgi:hypothetical protein
MITIRILNIFLYAWAYYRLYRSYTDHGYRTGLEWVGPSVILGLYACL